MLGVQQRTHLVSSWEILQNLLVRNEALDDAEREPIRRGASAKRWKGRFEIVARVRRNELLRTALCNETHVCIGLFYEKHCGMNRRHPFPAFNLKNHLFFFKFR